ncbi:MAG TPA: FHA domain-containing protein, partial [Nitrospiria bacterium]|nr:FHA domain-containing protein [Nitrospiria bacterium]
RFLLVPKSPPQENRPASMERTEVMTTRKKAEAQTEWSLEVVEGPQKGHAFTLSPGKKISLGRGAVDILINDTKISRHHADIEWVDGVFLYQDLKSTNGSIINDQVVDQHRLSPGDVLRLGETVLRVLRKQ